MASTDGHCLQVQQARITWPWLCTSAPSKVLLANRTDTSFPRPPRAHYKEYLVSLINAHSLDPATLYEVEELETATERYLHVRPQPLAGEEPPVYHARLLQVKPLHSLPSDIIFQKSSGLVLGRSPRLSVSFLSPAEADRRGAFGTEHSPQEEVAEGQGPVAQTPQEQLQHQ